jgi:hypothetical protein
MTVLSMPQSFAKMKEHIELCSLSDIYRRLIVLDHHCTVQLGRLLVGLFRINVEGDFKSMKLSWAKSQNRLNEIYSWKIKLTNASARST